MSEQNALPAPEEVGVAYRPETVEENEERVHVFLDAGVFAKVQAERLHSIYRGRNDSMHAGSCLCLTINSTAGFEQPLHPTKDRSFVSTLRCSVLQAVLSLHVV